MKKITNFMFLVCLLLLCMSGLSVSADATTGTCGENLTWSLAGGTLTISGNGDITDFSDPSAAPWYSLHSDITSVVIKNGVKSVGSYAFYRYENLVDVTIPDSVTSIGKSAFYFTKLVNVTIPSSVTNIGYGAFETCNKLTNVEILGNVTIETAAFKNCGNLNNVTIAGGFIGKDSFSVCTNLRTLTLGNNVTSIGWEAFYWCEYLTDITIPDSVTLIDYKAFCRCTRLTNIKLSENLDEIRNGAFSSCSSLKKITIPSKVTTLGGDIFKDCSSLESVDFKCDIKSIPGLFNGCTSLKNVNLPKNLVKVGGCCFTNCTSLESITLPDSVVSLEQACFSSCTALKSINTENIIDYGTSVFSDCVSLDTVLLNENITEIPGELFWGAGITSVKLPEGLQKIEYRAFSKTKIKTLVIPETVKDLGYAIFEDCTMLTETTIPKKITRLEHSLFKGCTALEKVTLHDNITSIGYDAFKNCSSLKNFTFPDNIDFVDYGAFYGTGITEITIPDSLMRVGKGGPFRESSIETVHFEKNRTEIPDYLFTGAKNLKNFDLSNITKIGSYAFADCASIIDFDIPGWMDKIPDGLLQGTGIGYVVFPETVKEIGNDTFNNCTNLSYIKFSNSVTDIGNYAFYGCTALDAVDIPGTVINIGSSAFENCSNLAEMTMHKGTQTLGSYAFANCNLTQVRPAQTIRELSDNMFYGNPVEILVVPRFCTEWSGWGNFFNNFNPTISYVSANVELFDIYTYEDATIKGVKGTAGETKATAESANGVKFEEVKNGIDELYFDKKIVDISLDETYDSAALVTIVSEPCKEPTTGHTEMDGEFITFATDNADVATVDSTGYVHANGYGTTKITVSCSSGIKDVLTVNVVRPSIGICISSGYEKISVGNTIQLTSDTIPNGYEEHYTWSTSDETIATVSDDGTVTGISAGTVVISVTGKNSKKTAKCAVTVTSENELPYSIDINEFSVGCGVTLSNAENGGNVIAALYDKNGTLLDTEIYPASDTVNVKFNLLPDVNMAGMSIKVFWWNSEMMQPISKFRLFEFE